MYRLYNTVGKTASLAFAVLALAVRNADGQTTWRVDGRGNVARYSVSEELADMELPNDAIGSTSLVTGQIQLDSAGHVVRTTSKIVVDVTALKSDRKSRDAYVRDRLLTVSQFPRVTFQPITIRGIETLPASGTVPIQITGNLTIKNVTRPVTWTGRATFSESTVTGHISTTFTFDQFELKKPSVMMVLSVDDSIILEYDFTFVRSAR